MNLVYTATPGQKQAGLINETQRWLNEAEANGQLWNVKREMWNVKREKWNLKCEIGNLKREMWKVERQM